MNNCFSIKSVKFNKKLEKFLLETKRDLDGFFETKIKDPQIFLLDSRKEINALCGKETEDWFVGWAFNGNIFILKESAFPKESSHKNKEYFWKVLKHEYCHLYFGQLTKSCYPVWLNEGLACFLAKQNKLDTTKEQKLKIFDYYSKEDKDVYKISYFWVKLLINNFGKEKLLKLLKTMSAIKTKEDFADKFFEIYGFNYIKSDFNKILDSNVNLSQN